MSTPLCLDDSTIGSKPLTGFLCIEPFIHDYVTVQALETALDCQLIEQLINTPYKEDDLKNAFPQLEALSMLLHLLSGANILSLEDDYWSISTDFKEAIPYLDLLKAKIEFANLVAPDLLQQFPLFLQNMPEFIQKANVFELFAYNRCFKITEENIKATQRWMRFTTSLTRHEARVIAHHYDFKSIKKHIDIGGNSGEFALQLCKTYPQLESTIIDLPVVCEVGKRHLLAEPENHRITFIAADALTAQLPTLQDIVTFKSILHDWPIEACQQFIFQAAQTLKKGGEILICERGCLNLKKPVPYGLLPMLLFNRSFREAEDYRQLLTQAGFINIKIKVIELETPFFLISAKLT